VQRAELASQMTKARWAKWREVNGPTSTREQRMERAGTKPCEKCGNSVPNTSKVRFCGKPECELARNRERQRRYMHERRARLLGNESEPFDPREVYERDGWICGICDLPVDPGLTCPNPGSVSLDHIVPVSLHGSHTRENTRCSHLGCNCKRGNRAA
jgi:hypothetical protein